MAVYKGREVSLLGKVGGADTSPLYTIQHKDGNREDVRLNQVQITEDEKKEMEKDVTWHLGSASVIDNKDLQELRDSQDKAKIEEKEGKKSPAPVEVSKVMVDPAEVQDKSTITPAMKTEKKAK
jgi:hypothetical protein